MPNESPVADLAGAILDGTPIDWALADSSVDETERPVLAQLRVLAAVADVHRRVPVDGEGLADWGPCASRPHASVIVRL